MTTLNLLQIAGRRARTRFTRSVQIAATGALLVLAGALRAGESKPQPLFESEQPLILRLTGPINDLIWQDGDDESWIPAKLALIGGTGAVEKEFDIGLNVRGNFRRKSGSCNFPPYWINLKKPEVQGTVFANQDKLKVVTHCQERKAYYAKYVYREYLAYKTYNLITDASFQVRLAEIDYIETEGWGKGKPKKHPAFLIEHHSRVADRLDGKEFEGQIALPTRFDQEALARAELFEFLIGNTDFSLFASVDECCHNAKVIQAKAGPGGFIPVPYDFDLSGIVNAPYAVPHPTLDLDSVTERLYRGTAVPPKVWEATVRHFLNKREAILQLWRNTPLLEEKEKRESVAYLEEFFAVLTNPKAIEKQITSKMTNAEAMDAFLKKKYPDAFKAER